MNRYPRQTPPAASLSVRQRWWPVLPTCSMPSATLSFYLPEVVVAGNADQTAENISAHHRAGEQSAVLTCRVMLLNT